LKASGWDKRTTITLNERVAVKDMILPPGEYVLKLLDSPADRRTVEVFNRDETHLIGTVLAVPAYRLGPTSDTHFTFYKEPDGQPPAMHTWFYPGDSLGIEFPSPKGSAESDSN
jgi:hypothetical protein